MKTQIYIFLVSSLLGIIACSGTKEITTIDSPEEYITSARTIPGDFDFFEIDKFDNIYLIKGNKLSKKDKLTGKTILFENDRYGEITSIDVSNPQKVLVFYAFYDLIITLDNSLAETSTIDLKRFEYTDINVVATSNDNQIWIYDPVSFTLRKINSKGQIIAESFRLGQYYLDQADPNFLVEHGNNVYMSSPHDGILVFDNLGQYNKLLPLKSLKDLQISNGNLIFLSDGKAMTYSTKQLDQVPVPGMDFIDTESCMQIRMTKTHYYLRYPDGIDKIEL